MLEQECSQREVEKCAVLDFLLRRVESLSHSGQGHLLAADLVRELATARNAPLYRAPTTSTLLPVSHTQVSPNLVVPRAASTRMGRSLQQYSGFPVSSSSSSAYGAQLSEAALFAEAKQHYLRSGQ
jgi:hypothetical protein